MNPTSPGSEVDEVRDILRTFGRSLWRLFVLAPEEIRPLPPWAQRLLLRAAAELGVADPSAPAEWLLRLFVLPTPEGAEVLRLRGIGRRLGAAAHAAGGLMRALLRLLWSPVTWISRRLDAVDFAPASRRLEHWSATASAWPLPLNIALGMLVLIGFYLATTTPMPLQEQLLFCVVLWLAALWLRRLPGNLPALLMMSLSLIATCRYAWWRLTQTMDLNSTAEYWFGSGLLMAEAYTWIIIFLGYLQGAWPLKRKPAALPADPALWPSVDLFIPTYNEPLSVVKPTVFAACGIEWPQDKLNIYILDDGRRPEFKAFAEEAGVRYMIRPDNAHAKAGNLNHALRHTQGEFIAIFDCDHIPVRSFLKTTMGWLLKEPRCAMVQTPHHFFSADPFERNLETFRRVPNESSLFYGLVQDGNDLWNATFFCGSCAVIRRQPLEEIGGIAVETVTEDAHTALKLHRRGYTTAYLNQVQAAGLATESLSSHIGQRIRWARGMTQIFRLDNPLFGKGLSLFQRLCYTNAMLHFFNGLPRLVFLSAPLAYLFFEMHIINAPAIVLAAYALPHLIQANLANSRIQGRYRHSFWAEVYESVLAWYIALPTTVAMINPRAGKFNVTPKGGLIQNAFLDWSISKPYLILVGLNLLGLAIGIVRLFYWNSFEQATVIMNLAWTVHNVVMLGTAVSVSVEARQMRKAHRITMSAPARLHLSDGRVIDCTTTDYSVTGFGLRLPPGLQLPRGAALGIQLVADAQATVFPATLTVQKDTLIGVQLDPMSNDMEMRLVQATFGREDAWAHLDDPIEADRPLRSLAEVLIFGLKGYVHLLRRSQNLFSRRVRALPAH